MLRTNSVQTVSSDVAIVGAGIAGIGIALAALRQGKTVTLCDRQHTPAGASIRNFGMVWPVGQPVGPLLDASLRSREIWLALSELADFFCEQSGSIHLAREDDELAVLSELVESDRDTRNIELLSPKEVIRRAPGVNPRGLLGGMFSPFELNVESRTAIAKVWDWIQDQDGVQLITGFHATDVTQGVVISSDGRAIEANEVYLTTGHDAATQYPDLFPSQIFVPCKLQMMRTIPQPDGWKMGTHIAGGWTLRHYESFANCPSLPALKQRISDEQPEFDQHGIHIMLSQHSNGDLVIGDSHAYGDAITPFDDDQIHNLILHHAKQLVNAPTWKIDKRWHGIYLKRTDQSPLLVHRPEPGVTIFNALGGAGMTLALGMAERVMNNDAQLWDYISTPITQSV